MSYPANQWQQQQQQIQNQQQQIAANQQKIAANRGQYAPQQQPQVVYGQQPQQQQQYGQPVQYVQPQQYGQPPQQQQQQYGQPPQQQQQMMYQPMQQQQQYGHPPQQQQRPMQQQVVYQQGPPQGQPVQGQQAQMMYQQPMQQQQGQRVQYVQQPQYQQQPMQQQQQRVVYQQPAAPQQGQQVVYGQPPQQGQPQMVYAQQQQPQYAQAPQVQKNAGPPPPSYGAHQHGAAKKKTIYEMADEKANSNAPVASGGAGGASGSEWDQPLPDAKGTCPVAPNWNQEAAMEKAKILRNAMKGLGCDKKLVAEVTGSMNANQRVMVRHAFQTVDQVLFQKGKQRNLLKDLKSELGGSYERLVMSCYESSAEFDAKQVLTACNGVGFSSDLLIEVICTRTNAQISAMKSAWTTSLRQNKSMVERVRSETKKMMSGNNFQHLMLALLEGKRPPNKKPDATSLMQDAEILNRTMKQDKKSEAKNKFVEIYTQRSWAHIGALSGTFQDVSKKYTLETAIKKTFGEGSDTSKALRVITRFTATPYDFWAQKLRESMKGLGTEDNNLIRLVVSRCEIDMWNIKQRFGQSYGNGKTLKNWIEGDVSGSYKVLLLRLCGYE